MDSEVGKHAITHYKVIEDFHICISSGVSIGDRADASDSGAHEAYLGHPLVFGRAPTGVSKILGKASSFSKYKQFVENCFTTLPRQASIARQDIGIHSSFHKTRGIDVL